MTQFKLISWNVNGIRAVQKKGFAEFLAGYNPDILCLQEVKAYEDQADLKVDGYHVIWNAATRPGYSGTAVLSRVKPLEIRLGLPSLPEENEGRVIALRYPSFWLINVYTPNAKRDLTRLEYRFKTWDPMFLDYLRQLDAGLPVVLCGDLNTAHRDVDLANPKSNKGNAGFTIEERTGLDNFEGAKFIDTFRQFEKGGGHYTWWSNRPGVRAKNIGWRIDYFWISQRMVSSLKSASIYPQVMGSDHCPIQIELKI